LIKTSSKYFKNGPSVSWKQFSNITTSKKMSCASILLLVKCALMQSKPSKAQINLISQDYRVSNKPPQSPFLLNRSYRYSKKMKATFANSKRYALMPVSFRKRMDQSTSFGAISVHPQQAANTSIYWQLALTLYLSAPPPLGCGIFNMRQG